MTLREAWIDRMMVFVDHLNGDFALRLGDAAGNNRVSGLNSGGVETYRIDSVGRGAFSELQGALDTGLAGRLVTPKAYGVLGAAIEDDDTSAAFGAALPVGSIVVLTNDGLREYVQTGSRGNSGGLPGHMHVPDANVEGVYTITRDLTGSGALDWRAGTMWYALGVEGDYWIELKNEYGNPRLDMFTLGASLCDLSNYFHVGGMNGLFGVSGTAHGVGIGDYSGGNYIRFSDVGGLQINAGGVNLATAFLPLTGGVLTGGLVVNESGADADTRIEGDTDANLIFVDAGLDKVGIGTNAPDEKLHVAGSVKLSGKLISTQATGIPPLQVASTTKVDNLNADLLDGIEAAGFVQQDGSGNVAVTGDLTLSGAAKRIIGDFTNATPADRTLVQTSTVNGTTNLGIMPNGTGAAAYLALFDGSDLANTRRMIFGINPTSAFINSMKAGTATPTRPIDLQIDGTTVCRIDTTGSVLIGTTTDGMTAAGSLAIAQDLAHRGTKVGFFNVTPATRPTAYTQTYSTASKTVPNPTAAALTDNSGGTASTTLEAIGTSFSQSQIRNNFADLAAMVNKNTADHVDLLKVVTALIDDLQALGLVQ